MGTGAAVAALATLLVLVAAGISAAMSTLKSDAKKPGRPSPHQAGGGVLIGALLATALGAMVVLAVNFGPAELQKTALGGVIALSGAGVAAVLAMRRAEEARRPAQRGSEEAKARQDAARVEQQDFRDVTLARLDAVMRHVGASDLPSEAETGRERRYRGVPPQGEL